MARMAAQWAARFDARQWPLTWPVWLHSGPARFPREKESATMDSGSSIPNRTF